MDHRRFYVINAMGGERGPYGLGQLQDALDAGEITGQDLIRTGMGTMRGTVADVLAKSRAPERTSGVGSGSRVGVRRVPVVGLITGLAALLIVGGIYFARPAEIVVVPATRAPVATPAPEVRAAPVPLPPPYPRPLIELAFSTFTRGSTPNTGSSAGLSTAGALSTGWPRVVAQGPGATSRSSVDFGTDPKPYAVDVAGLGTALANLRSFTVTGWLNNRDDHELQGGNRVLCWRKEGGSGVDLAYHGDGSLRIGINDWNDLGHPAEPPASSPGRITSDARADSGNWCFFAVTYDSQLPQRQLAFYFGTPQRPAALDRALDNASGPVGANTSAGLTIGHVSAEERPRNTVSLFRGLITQVRIWGSDIDGSGALALAQIVAVQQRALADPTHP